MHEAVLAILSQYPNLSFVTQELLNVWSNHGAYLERYFSSRDESDLKFLDEVASLIKVLAGKDLELYMKNYKNMCNQMLIIEMLKRKNKTKRLEQEVQTDLYNDDQKMSAYMHGLLISHLYWRQHAKALQQYNESFLPRLSKEYTVLEIGPGHGLTLALAAKQANCKEVYGWDIANASLQQTKKCFDLLKINKNLVLAEQDICAVKSFELQFDAIIMSEVLELVTDPFLAVSNIFKLLKPKGLAFFNVPVNMAAMDHTRTWHATEEIDALVKQAGFSILNSNQYLPLDTGSKEDVGFSYVVELCKS